MNIVESKTYFKDIRIIVKTRHEYCRIYYCTLHNQMSVAWNKREFETRLMSSGGGGLIDNEEYRLRHYFLVYNFSKIDIKRFNVITFLKEDYGVKFKCSII